MRSKLKLLAGASVVAATLAGGIAQASPISTFDVSVWAASTPNSTASSSNQQAAPTNPISMISTDLATTFEFAGLPNWDNASGSTNMFNTFVTRSSAITNQKFYNGYTSSYILSTPNFASTSLFELTFTTSQSISGTIQHDDGMSIWDSTNSNDIVNSAAPTNQIGTPFSLAAGTYNLWYDEANGAGSSQDDLEQCAGARFADSARYWAARPWVGAAAVKERPHNRLRLRLLIEPDLKPPAVSEVSSPPFPSAGRLKTNPDY